MMNVPINYARAILLVLMPTAAVAQGTLGTAAESAEIIITGTRNAYGVPKTGFGQKVPGDPLLGAQSVSVVTRDLIQDRQPRSFNEAIRTIPGVNARFGRVGSQNMRVRGFDLRNFGEYRNGLRRFQDFNLAPEIANVERFEILKGPASVLYGVSGPGGLLNIVTVAPPTTPEWFLAGEASGGSFDFWRGVVDAGGAITADGTLSARVTASYETTGGFQDFVRQKTGMVSSSLAWRPSADTELVVEAEYLSADYRGNVQGLPADGVALPSPNGQIPRNRAIMDPNFNELRRDQLMLGARLSHRFSDAVGLRAGVLHSSSNRNRLVESFASGFVGGFAGPRQQVTRNARTRLADWDSLAVDANIDARWSVLGLRQETVVGIDGWLANVDDQAIDVTLPPLDLNAPLYGVAPISGERRPISLVGRQAWVGLYGQHAILFGDHLRLVGGLRWSSINTRQTNRLNATLSRDVTDKPLTWRLGAVWSGVKSLSIWGSLNNSFIPVLGADVNGRAFAPERGKSAEIGARLQLVGDALSASVTLFDAERRNVTNNDPNNIGFLIQTGRQRSRGVEAELVGKPTPQLSLIAGYAWLDTEVRADTNLLVGQRFQGVPSHNASLFAKYTVERGPAQGLGIGIGVVGESSRAGAFVTAANPAGGFSVSGWVRADATLSYTRGPFEAALAVQNLTDRDYVSGVIARTIVYRGDPRTATLSLRYQLK